MSLCLSCNFDYFRLIHDFYENETRCIEFLREHGVLPAAVQCLNCGKLCQFRNDKNVWRCMGYVLDKRHKKRKYCNFTVSDRKGTFLDKVKLPVWKLMIFLCQFLSEFWKHRPIIKYLNISSKTSVDWRSFCSEVSQFWYNNQEPIGGVDVEVEIDETLITHSKYHKGRPLTQCWLFGGIERTSKKFFVEALIDPGADNRKSETLIPLINRYIKPGSIIYSDSWRGYNKISESGYTHFQVNHSENFVDPNNPNIHTQNIERLWLDIK
ncbi:uncharacterized protein [Palaemon carinicauda]|uniref:uncharacterized protein n=1 Tax=Palaemon carinicauda TaxID=392227 RepID=UPI0035B6871A